MSDEISFSGLKPKTPAFRAIRRLYDERRRRAKGIKSERHKDITGNKYNMLTAIKVDGRDKGKKAVWLFRCDCGSMHRCAAYSVTGGKTKSCGCRKKEISKQLIHLAHAVSRTAAGKLAAREGCRASPKCNGQTAVIARAWSLKTPDGRVFQFRNLAHFIKEHPEEFSPDQLRMGSNGRTTVAQAQLSQLSPRRKRVRSVAMGWTWHVSGEKDELGRIYGDDK